MRLKRLQSLGDEQEQQNRQDVYPPQPHSPADEQHHLLQMYWDDTWTQQHEENVLQAWASRTFSATCYKFTIQNDPETRSKTGPIYSFLENWQLHTMYNKSQKLLLGIEDIRPCVILTGDDFMFTPPPMKETGIYQQRMDYVEEDEEGDTNGEPSWIMYQPASPLHVVNVTDADYEDEDDDDYDDDDNDQPIMILGRDDAYSFTATTEWHQAVEHTTVDNKPTILSQNVKDIPRPTWRQWLQHGVFFVSQRMVEVAYLVAELAESMATERPTIHKSDRRVTRPLIKGGRYVVHLFRLWRVFFLGVETLLHQLFPLDTSHHIPLLILK